MPSPQWSCEHCGHASVTALRACDFCDSGMCVDCTEAHDEHRECPIDNDFWSEGVSHG